MDKETSGLICRFGLLQILLVVSVIGAIFLFWVKGDDYSTTFVALFLVIVWLISIPAFSIKSSKEQEEILLKVLHLSGEREGINFDNAKQFFERTISVVVFIYIVKLSLNKWISIDSSMYKIVVILAFLAALFSLTAIFSTFLIRAFGVDFHKVGVKEVIASAIAFAVQIWLFKVSMILQSGAV